MGPEAASKALFARLDSVPFAPHSAFADEAAKQRFETLVTFAHRRLQAARYHRTQIDSLVAENAAVAVAEDASQQDLAPAGGAEGTDSVPSMASKVRASKITRISDHQDALHELGAMLGVIRSSIDFLVKAVALLLKGHDADSISHF